MAMFCFDMDGTIADLYAVPNWLEKLQNEDVSPYVEAKPIWNMKELNTALMLLLKEGHEIRIISWLAKDSSESYKEAVRKAKMEWLKKYNFPVDKCHFVAYGTTKANCVRKADLRPAVLIDDNKKVRQGWNLGETIDPTQVHDLGMLLCEYLEHPTAGLIEIWGI